MNSSEKDVSDMLKKTFTPILLAIGIVGNLVSMLIFSNESLKKYTTFRLLFLLSLIDICVLLTGCGDILLQVYFNLYMRLINEYTCKIHSFMVIFFTHSSSMIMLFMSVDRAIAISVVLKRNQITAANKTSANKTNSTTNKIVLALFALISLLNVHILLFTHLIEAVPGPDLMPDGLPATENSSSSPLSHLYLNSTAASTSSDNKFVDALYANNKSFSAADYSSSLVREAPEVTVYCYGLHDSFYYYYLTVYFPWVDIFFYVMFPSFVMLICSIIIISKIIYTNGRMNSYGSKAFRKRTLRNKQISYLLLTTNFLFFFMVSPLLVLNAFSSIQENTIVTTVVYLLAYSNHGLNFISYGISSERYRTELIKIVKKVICWDKFSHSPVRTNEPNDQAIGRRATTTGGQL